MRRLLRPWVLLTVVLSSLLPFVGFSYRFRHELVGAVVYLPMVVVVATAQLAVLAFVAWRRPTSDLVRAAFVSAAVVLSVFSFDAWMDLLAPHGPSVLRLGIWAVATSLAIWGVWRLVDREWFRWGTSIFLGVLVITQAVSLGAYRMWVAGAEAPVVDAGLPPVAAVPAARPDVWWFVLDMMGRPDQVQLHAGADLGPFVDDLEGDGFVVADESWVSYPRTVFSLSSTLAMGYPFLPGADLRNEFAAGAPLLLDANPTMDRFRALGYQVAYAPAGGPHWTHCGAAVDVCAEPPTSLLRGDELQLALTIMSPVADLAVADTVHAPPSDALARVRAAVDPDRPLFAFVHVLSPHEPARYRDDCSLLDQAGIDDGPAVDRAAHYATDATCIAADMQRTVEQIVAEDPDAVIIIQGDHGSKLDGRWEPPDQWTAAQLTERFAILDALRLPPGCPVDDPRAAAAVNTFRLVFACLEGRRPDLVDYRAFNWSPREIDTLVELDTSPGPPGPPAVFADEPER